MAVSVDVLKAVEIAKIREGGKTGFNSHRPLSTDYEVIGVMGEMAFSEFSTMPVDESRKINGDKGTDFTLALKIDVKTARQPHHLIVEEGKVISDIYVLAKADPTYSADVELLGWMWGYKVKKAPVDDGRRFKNGIRNHFIPVEGLYPMELLKNILPS